MSLSSPSFLQSPRAAPSDQKTFFHSGFPAGEVDKAKPLEFWNSRIPYPHPFLPHPPLPRAGKQNHSQTGIDVSMKETGKPTADLFIPTKNRDLFIPKKTWDLLIPTKKNLGFIYPDKNPGFICPDKNHPKPRRRR